MRAALLGLVLLALIAGSVVAPFVASVEARGVKKPEATELIAKAIAYKLVIKRLLEVSKPPKELLEKAKKLLEVDITKLDVKELERFVSEAKVVAEKLASYVVAEKLISEDKLLENVKKAVVERLVRITRKFDLGDEIAKKIIQVIREAKSFDDLVKAVAKAEKILAAAIAARVVADVREAISSVNVAKDLVKAYRVLERAVKLLDLLEDKIREANVTEEIARLVEVSLKLVNESKNILAGVLKALKESKAVIVSAEDLKKLAILKLKNLLDELEDLERIVNGTKFEKAVEELKSRVIELLERVESGNITVTIGFLMKLEEIARKVDALEDIVQKASVVKKVAERVKEEVEKLFKKIVKEIEEIKKVLEKINVSKLPEPLKKLYERIVDTVKAVEDALDEIKELIKEGKYVDALRLLRRLDGKVEEVKHLLAKLLEAVEKAKVRGASLEEIKEKLLEAKKLVETDKSIATILDYGFEKYAEHLDKLLAEINKTIEEIEKVNATDEKEVARVKAKAVALIMAAKGATMHLSTAVKVRAVLLKAALRYAEAPEELIKAIEAKSEELAETLAKLAIKGYNETLAEQAVEEAKELKKLYDTAMIYIRKVIDKLLKEVEELEKKIEELKKEVEKLPKPLKKIAEKLLDVAERVLEKVKEILEELKEGKKPELLRELGKVQHMIDNAEKLVEKVEEIIEKGGCKGHRHK